MYIPLFVYFWIIYTWIILHKDISNLILSLYLSTQDLNSDKKLIYVNARIVKNIMKTACGLKYAECGFFITKENQNILSYWRKKKDSNADKTNCQELWILNL